MATALIVIDMQNFVTDRINQGVEMFPDNAISNMYAILEIFRKLRESGDTYTASFNR
ncbi:Uncharacterised protein [Salmonella enterica subsp. enterica]|uniref:Uncharacterized protein n=1 Tax=Salmonella enterica I TaxID=59201 RepID=A0A3S4ISV8_SALET|nr:Uncharacterised protein [Salmonella enterica subsp. enterica]